MQKIEEKHLVELSPERGRTDNALLDSDVEIRMNLLALPTPPSSRRGVVANLASTELAGAQQNLNGTGNRNTRYDVTCDPTPSLITTPAHALRDGGAASGVSYIGTNELRKI